MSRLYRKRRFAPQLGGDSTVGPLERCLAWARGEGRVQRVHYSDGEAVDYELDFLVLAHETEDTKREYEALDAVELERWARAPAAERHAHEVVWTSTKLYVDIDMQWAPNADKVRTISERFTDVLVRAVSERYNVAANIVVLDSSIADVKLSRHIIVDMHQRDGDGTPMRFASHEHCGAFVREVVERCGFADVNARDDGAPPTPLVDYSIYSRNSCLRTLGSTKLDDETRPLTMLVDSVGDLSASLSTASSRPRNVVDFRQLERSLVTWPRVTDESAMLRADTVDASTSRRLMKRPRTPTSSTPPPDEVTAIIAATIDGARGCIRSVKRGASDPNTLLVSCTSRACTLAGRQHRSSPIFFLVDVERGTWARGCHSPKCKPVRYVWQPLELEAAAALRQLTLSSSSSSSSSPPMADRRPLARSAPARVETTSPAFKSAMDRIFLYKPIP